MIDLCRVKECGGLQRPATYFCRGHEPIWLTCPERTYETMVENDLYEKAVTAFAERIHRTELMSDEDIL